MTACAGAPLQVRLNVGLGVNLELGNGMAVWMVFDCNRQPLGGKLYLTSVSGDEGQIGMFAGDCRNQLTNYFKSNQHHWIRRHSVLRRQPERCRCCPLRRTPSDAALWEKEIFLALELPFVPALISDGIPTRKKQLAL